jgi:hypothetical protein
MRMRLSILSIFSNTVGLMALAIMKMNRRCRKIEKESFITSDLSFLNIWADIRGWKEPILHLKKLYSASLLQPVGLLHGKSENRSSEIWSKSECHEASYCSHFEIIVKIGK